MLFYDENQRSHWAVIEETTTQSVDEETQEPITLYEYSYKLLDEASDVVANPTLSGDEATLNGLEVDGTKYKVGGGSEVHLYEHKLTIIGYENLSCYMHPIYLSTESAITKDNISSDLIGWNYKDNNSNICHTDGYNRIGIGNLGSMLITGVTDTVTKIF